ncbi:conserved hypothetical protein [Pediculus humanus corporis]|uniref:TBC1 domain family member 15 n=1 Tax=Pediculus humanus subsp. corporis TaxID=121224 RepID=E0W3X4_PEDHC|nr:uncharacterized protein Phum_PHUM612120 [Pediculus humanus corporis]EEB20330.1 conserved hypothetical protein [Pediculus humanus corporis]
MYEAIITPKLITVHPNLFIVKSQKEIQSLEQSFAELNLFTDDNTRSDAIWSFIKNLQDRPYETTLSAFSKVTDAFSYKPQFTEVNNGTDILNKSFASEEFPQFSYSISPDDFELSSKESLLPPRTLPLRSSPLNVEKWSAYIDDSGRIQDLNAVKDIIFHGGISWDLKSEVWKFLLGYYPWDSTFCEREVIREEKKNYYFTMKAQWKTKTLEQENNFFDYKERKSLIEKDVCRTDRNLEFFAGNDNPNIVTLKEILMTYVMYNFDLGYVQGMSDLLSPLLMQLKDEVDTFWCFVGFMNKVYRNFDINQAEMKEQLCQIHCLLRVIEPELANYLERHESGNMYFCFRWVLIWFKREFNHDQLFTLWEALWTDWPCKNFHLLVSAAILDTEKDRIISNNYGFTEILKHINELANNIDSDMILRKAEGIYFQLSTASKIPSAVREIIGLPPLPQLDSDEVVSVKSDSNKESIIENEKNAATTYSPFENNEIAFDNSLSLQYL